MLKPFALQNNIYGSKVFEEADQEPNPKVGFKHVHYSVAQEAASLTMVIEKHTHEELSFWVETESAGSNQQYHEPLKELVTMKAAEFEREVLIKIRQDKIIEQEE